MKKIFPLLFATLFFISCSKESNDSEELNSTLGNITINTKNIRSVTADIEWTATASNGITIAFDIYLEGKKIKENFSGTKFTLEGLTAATTYSGKIIAKGSNGNSKEKEFSFTTIDNPNPSTFEIELENTTTNSTNITWSIPTITDNATIFFDVFLNDELVKNNLTTYEYALEELSPNTDYTLKITAKTEAGGQTSINKTFKTLELIMLDFPLHLGGDGTFDDKDPYWLIVNWTPPTVEDDSNFHYSIYLNDALVLII